MVSYSSQKFPVKDPTRYYLFLAGSMDDNRQEGWRQEVITTFENCMHILDPTKVNYNNTSEEEMNNHTLWEIEAMEMADQVLLNLLPDSLSPISLVELGMYIASGKLTVVCPESFYKSKYITTLCTKYRVPIYRTLDTALNSFKQEY